MQNLTIDPASAPAPDDDDLDAAAVPDQVETDPQPAPEPKRRRINEWWERRQEAKARKRPRRTTRASRPVADRSGWAILGVAALAVLVLVIVAVGLSVSLGPLRDTALAVHIDPTAASLWWIGIDGLVVVAIIAAMVLRHDRWARFYALGVVAFFTAASGLLQYLHGTGLTAADQAAGGDPSIPGKVVALVAVLVIGTIFCATHLLVYVLRHLFPGTMADQPEQASKADPAVVAGDQVSTDSDTDTEDGPDENERPEPVILTPEVEKEIRKWFAACAIELLLDAGIKPTRSKIAGSFGLPDRQAGYVISDVVADREEAGL